MSDVSWMNHPAMKDIDARKLAVIVEFVNAVEGKSGKAAMPILMQTQKILHDQGLEFTPEETDLMMTILTKDMTAAEKAKVEQMKQIVGRYRKNGK